MSIKSQLSMLVKLANIDNDFADDEKDMIFMVGKANGISEEEITGLLENPEPLPPLGAMTDDDKFEYLFNVVQLMKIDKEVFLSEVKYCEEVAVKLGFKKAVIAELSAKVYSDPGIVANRESLKKAVLKYQN
ncbi:TerB family tellurite resistance protein [Reichenbachiella carrageenanivorans]|uniref:TerB family tellurite resistance protein n=1 Tax=Reichenbachiella carrageenanivorans TaxID=2979869 RepID=A0ABY6D3K6_9BACT|nr:TerB family tellurite resistance protein [Reichenbachiella carrageenanivorans]UXX80737.1 TerB family tellurite resistance protein [Reichenbachiella carrageenanivorans]